VVQSQPRQIVHKTLSQKHPTHKRAGGVTQIAEHLPSNCEALSSSSSTAKRKKEGWREGGREEKKEGRKDGLSGSQA
jgi:hypothetical protein